MSKSILHAKNLNSTNANQKNIPHFHPPYTIFGHLLKRNYIFMDEAVSGSEEPTSTIFDYIQIIAYFLCGKLWIVGVMSMHFIVLGYSLLTRHIPHTRYFLFIIIGELIIIVSSTILNQIFRSRNVFTLFLLRIIFRLLKRVFIYYDLFVILCESAQLRVDYFQRKVILYLNLIFQCIDILVKGGQCCLQGCDFEFQDLILYHIFLIFSLTLLHLPCTLLPAQSQQIDLFMLHVQNRSKMENICLHFISKFIELFPCDQVLPLWVDIMSMHIIAVLQVQNNQNQNSLQFYRTSFHFLYIPQMKIFLFLSSLIAISRLESNYEFTFLDIDSRYMLIFHYDQVIQIILQIKIKDKAIYANFSPLTPSAIPHYPHTDWPIFQDNASNLLPFAY